MEESRYLYLASRALNYTENTQIIGIFAHLSDAIEYIQMIDNTARIEYTSKDNTLAVLVGKDYNYKIVKIFNGL